MKNEVVVVTKKGEVIGVYNHCITAYKAMRNMLDSSVGRGLLRASFDRNCQKFGFGDFKATTKTIE